ncbi:Chromosome segregation protein Spc25 family protein [Theileria parva strain Muguga]|uniref:Chromosome segregation protein Spc25 family protein n=1 Tax=Theileria parva strain Muguga TaxID=333668 RepID=UPI001C6227F1|nr:Chromosome segregation protein Spc25 family protein [Theileria parva strain Muguga]EAN30692.2 Chromosome segregation protein Spc25 family protein [Theileria parva strain Muguga]
MENEPMSVDNDKKHSNTELFGSSSLMSEDLLSFVPSESMFKFNRLNLNQIDQNKVKETLQNQKDDFLNKMSSVTKINRSLKSTIDELSHSTSSILKEIQINDISFNSISDDVSNVYKQIEDSKNLLNDLRTEKSHLKSILSSKSEEYESYFKNKNSQDIWSCKAYYLELLLGVKISSLNGSMKISFSRLISSDPYKNCTIILKLEDERFTGISSDPPIKDFSRLVNELNNGLDFGSFLCLIRKSFKLLLQPT